MGKQIVPALCFGIRRQKVCALREDPMVGTAESLDMNHCDVKEVEMTGFSQSRSATVCICRPTPRIALPSPKKPFLQ
jgi:hypothetical protein